MSDNKKYYYLKLKENFFDRAEIKAIEAFQNGYEYICIMQKMYLRSLSREGKLMITDKIPYQINTLSKVLGHKEETIKIAIEIFREFGLLEILDDKSIYMTEIQNFIGESSTEADRIREYRKRINNKKEKLLPKSTSVQMYDKSTPELELELELEKELKKNNIFSVENNCVFFDTKNCSLANIKSGLPKIFAKGNKNVDGMCFWHCPKDQNLCWSWFNRIKKEIDIKYVSTGNKLTSQCRSTSLYVQIFTNCFKDLMAHPDSWLLAEIKKQRI